MNSVIKSVASIFIISLVTACAAPSMKEEVSKFFRV